MGASCIFVDKNLWTISEIQNNQISQGLIAYNNNLYFSGEIDNKGNILYGFFIFH